MATMNLKSLKDLNLEDKNINNKLLIINQNTNNSKNINTVEYIKDSLVRVISFNEKGISRSRNRGIENSVAPLILISDDDVIYKKNYEKIIIDAFKNNQEYDIIFFRAEDENGNLCKKYFKKQKKLNIFSIRKAHSICLAFKLDSLKKHHLKFDELFGLGSKYIEGEEIIFLADCLKKGLKILFVPETIVIHPGKGSGRVSNSKSLISKGAVFYRIYKNFAYILGLLFVIKKIKYLINNNIGLLKGIKYIFLGIKEYKNEH
jgi:hypothetical protein